MTTGRITFRKGGHPSSRMQLVSGPVTVPLSQFDGVFREIEAARERNKRKLPKGERPELNARQKRKLVLNLIGAAQIHSGLRENFDEDPRAQDVKATLLALARSADRTAFLAALRDCDAMTRDKVALAAWKAHKREGDRTPTEILARLGIEELRQLASRAADAWHGGQGRRPPNEHDRVAVRMLAKVWMDATGTRASAGAKVGGGPFTRFLDAAVAAMDLRLRATWDLVRISLTR